MKIAQLIPMLSLAAHVAGCGTTYVNRSPVGETFPSVRGKGLDGKEWRIPEGMKGKPAMLLIGYKQNSQFDIDRWFIGLDMTPTIGASPSPTSTSCGARSTNSRVEHELTRTAGGAHWLQARALGRGSWPPGRDDKDDSTRL